MDLFLKIFIIYLIAVNLFAIIITVKDKSASVKHKRRTPEKNLLLISAIGGSVGMYITMRIIRHKTLHAKFMIGIPVIFLIQCALVFLLLKYVFVLF